MKVLGWHPRIWILVRWKFIFEFWVTPFRRGEFYLTIVLFAKHRTPASSLFMRKYSKSWYRIVLITTPILHWYIISACALFQIKHINAKLVVSLFSGTWTLGGGRHLVEIWVFSLVDREVGISKKGSQSLVTTHKLKFIQEFTVSNKTSQEEKNIKTLGWFSF